MSTADDLLRRVVEMCNAEDWDTDSNFDELLDEINSYLDAPKDEPVYLARRKGLDDFFT